MGKYLIEKKLDNAIHDISQEQLNRLHIRNIRDKTEGLKITQSSYRGEHYYEQGKDFREGFAKEVLYRDPLTAGMLVEYPHGVIIQQAQRRNFYRGENKQYTESISSLLRTLNNPENGYITRKEKELYRLVSDMRIAEFTLLLQKFEHVKNWEHCDILYDVLAQHYGLETEWLDITSDFDIALFFATCTYEKGRWRSLTKADTEKDENSKYGMIFHMPSFQMVGRWYMNINKFVERQYYDRYDNLIYPIGFQPFMRCAMQEGYGIHMRRKQSLQGDIGFEKLRFRHSEELSKEIFERMEGGQSVYPHEGLSHAQYIIDEIKTATIFSKEAFKLALQRNHYYRVQDEEQCLKDLESFRVKIDSEYKQVKIKDNSPWRISSGRRKNIDFFHKRFNLEEWYDIKISERQVVPAGQNMYEPWMLLEYEDSPGSEDFKPRVMTGCTNLRTRTTFNMMATLISKREPDFL